MKKIIAGAIVFCVIFSSSAVAFAEKPGNGQIGGSIGGSISGSVGRGGAGLNIQGGVGGGAGGGGMGMQGGAGAGISGNAAGDAGTQLPKTGLGGASE